MSHHLDQDPIDRRVGGHVPFSEEQIEFLEASRKRSVEQAIRRYRNQALLGFTSLLIGLLVVLGVQQRDLAGRRVDAQAQRVAIVESGRAVATNSCNARFEDRLQIRGVLLASKRFARIQLKQGNITPGRYADTVKFYDERLRKLKLPDCRVDANLLTSDPEEHIPVIRPLYPDAPYAPKEGG